MKKYITLLTLLLSAMIVANTSYGHDKDIPIYYSSENINEVTLNEKFMSE